MGQKEDILLSLLQGPDAQAWAVKNRGWDANISLDGCGWEGIKCDPVDYSVTSIALPQIGISGTIPPGLAQFTNLATIDFFGNNLVGTIPQGVLTLPNLVVFNVMDSGLNGPFPVFKSKSLDFLNIAGNSFNGGLPNDIGTRYPALITLNIANNTFVGTLPKTITSLTNLDTLNVAHNQLMGTIPDDLGKLVHLKGLFMNDNRFIGTIPRSLAHLESKLIQIFVQHNSLSGTIPANLAELPQLIDFFVDGNKLTGTVPMELCEKSLNNAYFVQIPGSEARGGCESIACPVDSKSVEGVFPCETCPLDRISPYLGRNGNCIAIEQKHILDSFFHDANGLNWVGAARWGNPNVPVCMYEGIECDGSGNVVNMTLTNMNLRGPISFKLGRLHHLRRLNLADNFLTGEVPSDLRFAPLEFLDLSGNQLEGPLPPLLCLMADLNGNGAGGHYSCDVISCPGGTWHSRGFADSGGSCMPCVGSSCNLIGQRSCGMITFAAFENMGHMAKERMGYSGATIIGILALVAFLTFIVMGRRKLAGVEKVSGSREYYQDPYYKKSGGNGDSNSGFQEEYGIAAEELTIMPYGRHVIDVHGSGDMQRLPAVERNEVITTPPQASGILQRRRDSSPEDDPETQDLWLDVPKIA